MDGIKSLRPLLVTLVEMAGPSYKMASALRLKLGLAHSLNGLGMFPSPQRTPGQEAHMLFLSIV